MLDFLTSYRAIIQSDSTIPKKKKEKKIDFRTECFAVIFVNGDYQLIEIREF